MFVMIYAGLYFADFGELKAEKTTLHRLCFMYHIYRKNAKICANALMATKICIDFISPDVNYMRVF